MAVFSTASGTGPEKMLQESCFILCCSTTDLLFVFCEGCKVVQLK